MAILSKIRDRSLFLIIIIGLALFSFVLSGIFKSNSPLFNKNQNLVGEINGEDISREEFARLVEQQRARTGDRGSQLQSVNAAWNYLIREKVYKTQLEKSGITVGEKDVWDAIINQPFVQNNPQFKNEAGVFDEEKFKEYIATLQDDASQSEQGKITWLNWLNYEQNIKSNLQISTYNNLINAGLGVTLKDGERYYFDNNTKLDLEYVFIPYSYIPDSTITITDDEIKEFVRSHPDQYKTEASRDIKFVKFDIKATPEDEQAIKTKLAKFINNWEEYSAASKNTEEYKGLRTTDNVEEFFRENNSDTPLDTKYYFKSKLNKAIADTIFNMNVGEVYGPYKDGEYFKISKLVDVKQLPDSAKARHILIPFIGSLRADASVTQTEEEAKKTADSLLAVINKDKSKFADLAKKFSADKFSATQGGDLKWFTYDTMVPEFRDFAFENKVGDIGVVKSNFGFHVIEITGQKNKEKAVQVATFSRKIEASEETENAVFLKAETFTSELSQGKDMAELAKENKVTIQPVIGLKAMDEKVSTLGYQRPIVTWTFEKSTKENDVKRFDIENGYAVVQLTKKHKKGLRIGSSKFQIRTLLMNKKKAALIKEKIKSDDLQEIAKTFNKTVNSSKAVSLGSPVLPGIGRASDLISMLLPLEENKTYTGLEAHNGVFAVKIVKKVQPKALENYSSFTGIIATTNRQKGAKAYDAIKKLADIEDYRATFY
jgi:peptidylprolyl isomerase/peptidyl-prolyl cis-trans isomerase D